ncbi:MAG TPA: single-stranded DNA-binding protein, partial [Thermovirgaceae bacterium]|nr:single-stranded DNA-binding protein [Thermovirgaceae bacterium]
MARGFNKAILMGNLARDPEVRYTTSKQAVARLTVAVNRQWKNRDGEVQDQADFIPVVVWGSQAE